MRVSYKLVYLQMLVKQLQLLKSIKLEVTLQEVIKLVENIQIMIGVDLTAH